MWGRFPKLAGPYHKGYGFLGSILGYPHFGKVPYLLLGTAVSFPLFGFQGRLETNALPCKRLVFRAKLMSSKNLALR